MSDVPKATQKNLARFPETDANAIWAALDEIERDPFAGNICYRRGTKHARRWPR